MKQAYLGKDIKVKATQIEGLEEYDSGWIAVNNVLKYRRVGRTVTVIGDSAGTKSIGDGSYTNVGTLPMEARTTTTFQFEYSLTGGAIAGRAARCSSNGDVTLYLPKGQTSAYWGFAITYVR